MNKLNGESLYGDIFWSPSQASGFDDQVDLNIIQWDLPQWDLLELQDVAHINDGINDED